MGVDFNFLKLYGIPLLAGRNFTPLDYNADFNNLHNILISESAAKSLGFSSNEEALGKGIIRIWQRTGMLSEWSKIFTRNPCIMQWNPLCFLPFNGSDHPISVKLNTRDLAFHHCRHQIEIQFLFPGQSV